MEGNNVLKLHRVAGTVRAVCACCAVRQTLVTQAGLEEPRRLCPATGQAYRDRGDGLYEPDGEGSPPGPAPDSPRAGERVTAVEHTVEESPLLSDRPKRTGAKTRIELERATFASRGGDTRWSRR